MAKKRKGYEKKRKMPHIHRGKSKSHKDRSEK